MDRVEKSGTPRHFCWEWRLAAPVENTTEGPKNLKIEQAYDPAIPLLGHIQRETCPKSVSSPKFTAAHSQQPGRDATHSSWGMDNRDVGHIYNGTVLFVNGDKCQLLASQTDLEVGHTKWVQVRWESVNIIWDHLYGESEKKNDTNGLIHETEQTHRT